MSEEDALTSDLVCSKSSCWSWIQSAWKENNDGTIDGGHNKTDGNGDVTYNKCSHGNTGPHYLACTTHPEYSGKAHWYCTTHNYVGTSSMCTYVDVAVNPSPKSMSITVGQSQQITPNATAGASVSYISNNANVAAVNSAGIVTGHGKGSAIITVKAKK